VGIELARLSEDGAREVLARVSTDADGRAALGAVGAGTHELVFDVGTYFGEATFLDRVPVRFAVADPEAHYHVPLLTSPWAYSTYRGS
jgi:hydroxyisourate hydrolase